jgi:hypothetical protein
MRFGGNSSGPSTEIVMKTSIVVGVGLLVLAWPAEAEIVYHSAKITIDNGVYNLDLNGDAVTDFTIESHTSGGCMTGGDGVLSVTPSSENGAMIGPLTEGDEIGPDQVFAEGELTLAEYMIGEYPRDCPLLWSGTWFDANVNRVTTGYLGLSFLLNGEIYYGWAELSVSVPFHLKNGKPGISATLKGYAYESIPGKAINAGKKTGE